MKSNPKISFSTLVILILTPHTVLADMGVPMLFVTAPIMGLTIIPIIAIEMWVFRKMLVVTKLKAFQISTIANLLSTCIGIPFTWLLLVSIQMAAGGNGGQEDSTVLDQLSNVTIYGAWLLPSAAENSKNTWMIPTAQLWLLIPFFYISYLFERLIAQELLPDFDYSKLKKAVFRANLYTYGMLAGFCIVMIIMTLV